MPEIPSLLRRVAHIVLQVGESVPSFVEGLSETEWNARPAGVASAAFHVRHIIGVLDRLFTYARGAALSEAQFAALRAEDEPIALGDAPTLLHALADQVQPSLAPLRATNPDTLGDFRAVGRAQLPSTVIGCLVHGAEHSKRHEGQLSVRVRMLRATHTG